MTCPVPHFIDIEVAVLAWGARQGVRHLSRFSQAASLTLQCSRPAINVLPSRGYSNLVIADGIENCARTILSVALIGNLRGLNATGLLLI